MALSQGLLQTRLLLQGLLWPYPRDYYRQDYYFKGYYGPIPGTTTDKITTSRVIMALSQGLLQTRLLLQGLLWPYPRDYYRQDYYFKGYYGPIPGTTTDRITTINGPIPGTTTDKITTSRVIMALSQGLLQTRLLLQGLLWPYPRDYYRQDYYDKWPYPRDYYRQDYYFKGYYGPIPGTTTDKITTSRVIMALSQGLLQTRLLLQGLLWPYPRDYYRQDYYFKGYYGPIPGTTTDKITTSRVIMALSQGLLQTRLLLQGLLWPYPRDYYRQDYYFKGYYGPIPGTTTDKITTSRVIMALSQGLLQTRLLLQGLLWPYPRDYYRQDYYFKGYYGPIPGTTTDTITTSRVIMVLSQGLLQTGLLLQGLLWSYPRDYYRQDYYFKGYYGPIPGTTTDRITTSRVIMVLSQGLLQTRLLLQGLLWSYPRDYYRQDYYFKGYYGPIPGTTTDKITTSRVIMALSQGLLQTRLLLQGLLWPYPRDYYRQDYYFKGYYGPIPGTTTDRITTINGRIPGTTTDTITTSRVIMVLSQGLLQTRLLLQGLLWPYPRDYYRQDYYDKWPYPRDYYRQDYYFKGYHGPIPGTTTDKITTSRVIMVLSQGLLQTRLLLQGLLWPYPRDYYRQDYYFKGYYGPIPGTTTDKITTSRVIMVLSQGLLQTRLLLQGLLWSYPRDYYRQDYYFKGYYRTPTDVIDHETFTDNFLYRPKLVNNSFCGCELFTFTDAL